MAEIDRLPVAALLGRYKIGKTALYARLNALEISPTKDGRISYVSGEQLGELDKLHEQIKSGGTLPQPSDQDESLTDPLPPEVFTSSLDSLNQRKDAIVSLVQSVATAIRPSDPFQHYDTLERFARFGWNLHSRQVRQLIGKMPRGNRYEWGGGFTFHRIYLDDKSQPWWRVEKNT
jgi:hypothetical protein